MLVELISIEIETAVKPWSTGEWKICARPLQSTLNSIEPCGSFMHDHSPMNDPCHGSQLIASIWSQPASLSILSNGAHQALALRLDPLPISGMQDYSPAGLVDLYIVICLLLFL